MLWLPLSVTVAISRRVVVIVVACIAVFMMMMMRWMRWSTGTSWPRKSSFHRHPLQKTFSCTSERHQPMIYSFSVFFPRVSLYLMANDGMTMESYRNVSFVFGTWPTSMCVALNRMAIYVFYVFDFGSDIGPLPMQMKFTYFAIN